MPTTCCVRKVDLDDLAAAYDEAVGRLVSHGAHVVMFTIVDPGPSGIYSAMRGRMAIFNEFAREISDRHGASLVDMWRMRDQAMAEVMDTDRMHLNPIGHQHIAFAVLDALGIDHAEEPLPRTPAPAVDPLRTAARRRSVDSRLPRTLGAPTPHRPLLGRRHLAEATHAGPDRNPLPGRVASPPSVPDTRM